MAVRTSAMLYKLFSTRIELSKVIHIFQSAYAKEFVRSELKLEGLMVSDYTRQKVELSIKESKKVELNKKLSGFTIVYNPSKGLAHVSILEKILEPKVTFIPLQGFTYGQLLYLFDNADLYLDLGSLPGKDRLPRESILAGCPIMITTWGAGYNSTDFPVPNKYKLRMDVTPPREAAQSILNILELGKSENLKMQKYFQDLVSQEKAIFYKEVCEFANLFVNP